MFNLPIAGHVHVEDQKLAINVSAYVLVQDSTRPSAGAVLTPKFKIEIVNITGASIMPSTAIILKVG